MWCKKIFFLPVALFAVSVSAMCSPSPLILAERGTGSDYSVSIPEKASPCLRHAAEELSRYVSEMTGVRLPVVEGATEGPKILLSSKGLAENDAFLFKACGRDLVIRGRSDRAVLFGVYDFLENQCGCEWLSAVHEIVPQRERIAVAADFELVRKPAFWNRECGWTEAYQNPDFAAKLKLNGYRFSGVYGEKQGGKPPAFDDVLSICHTFRKILPPERHFKEHPEWFSEVNGRRISENTQLCLTNPDVLARTIEFVRARIAKTYPRVKAYGISQNDWWNFCTCPNCRAIDEREESHAGTLVNFVNKVAEAIAPDYPDVRIQTLAYLYSYLPPKHLKCHENVMITFCTDAFDMSRPLKGNRYRPGGRAPFETVLAGWKEKCRHIYIWDYAFNFCFMNHAFPNVYSIGPNIRFFAENGVDAMYEEGAHHGRHAESSELKLWLAAHLQWDPTLDDRALIDRFLKAYFGAAAPFARSYYDEMDRLQTDESKWPQKMWGSFFSPVMTDAFFEKAADLWRQAAEAVKDDPKRAYNVRWAMNANDYTRIFRSNLGASFECTRHPEYRLSPRFVELQTAAKRIVADLKADGWKGKLGEDADGNRRGERRIRSLANLDPSGIVASDRAVIPGDFLSANGTQFWFGDIHTDPGALYRIRVKMNVRRKPSAPASGTALLMRIDDMREKRDYSKPYALDVAELEEGSRWYEFPGAYELAPHHRFLVSDETYDVRRDASNPYVERPSIEALEIRFADTEPIQE